MPPSRRSAGATNEDQVLGGRAASRFGWPASQSLAILLAIVMQQAAGGRPVDGTAFQFRTRAGSSQRLTVGPIMVFAAVRTLTELAGRERDPARQAAGTRFNGLETGPGDSPGSRWFSLPLMSSARWPGQGRQPLVRKATRRIAGAAIHLGWRESPGRANCVRRRPLRTERPDLPNLRPRHGLLISLGRGIAG